MENPAPSPEQSKIALVEHPSLINWERLEKKILRSFGTEERWPEHVLVVTSEFNVEGYEEVEAEAAKSSKNSVGMRLRDFLLYKHGLPALIQDLKEEHDAIHDPSETPDPIMTSILEDIQRRITFFESTAIEPSHGVVFVVTAKEIPECMRAMAELEQITPYKFAVLVSDPPHLWKEVYPPSSNCELIELEDREIPGIEIIGDAPRRKSVEKILDTLAPLVAVQIPLITDPLIRSLRQELFPETDVGIERATIKELHTTGETRRHLADSASEREARWKVFEPEKRQKSAERIEFFLRPKTSSDECPPLTHAQIVLRLATLDPDCLPVDTIAAAKNMFSSEAQRLVGNLHRASDKPASTITDTVVLRIAKSLLLDPRFNDAYAPLLGYAAEAAVDRLSEEADLSKNPVEEAERRIKRAKEAGYDTSALEKRLATISTQGTHIDTALALKK